MCSHDICVQGFPASYWCVPLAFSVKCGYFLGGLKLFLVVKSKAVLGNPHDTYSTFSTLFGTWPDSVESITCVVRFWLFLYPYPGLQLLLSYQQKVAWVTHALFRGVVDHEKWFGSWFGPLRSIPWHVSRGRCVISNTYILHPSPWERRFHKY